MESEQIFIQKSVKYNNTVSVLSNLFVVFFISVLFLFSAGFTRTYAVSCSACNAESQQIVDSAASQVAQHYGIPLQQIVFSSIEFVEWPDSSLGCPQAGMMYAAVVTPGYRVIFTIDGTQVEVHTSTSQYDQVEYCAAPGVICSQCISAGKRYICRENPDPIATSFCVDASSIGDFLTSATYYTCSDCTPPTSTPTPTPTSICGLLDHPCCTSGAPCLNNASLTCEVGAFYCRAILTPTPIDTPTPAIPTSTPTVTPTVDPCPLFSQGDATCDSNIGTIDYLCWKTQYLTALKGETPVSAGSCIKIADFNSDSQINLLDFAIWWVH